MASRQQKSVRSVKSRSSGIMPFGCDVEEVAEEEEPLGPDYANKAMSRNTRIFIFLLFCICTQAFMSYDGGATPVSIDALKAAAVKQGTKTTEGLNGTHSACASSGASWTEFDVAVLGTMPYLGMGTAIFWGRGLQLFPAKVLLIIGLGLNASATMLFALRTDKALMMSCKFFMGITQALQGVWGTVWTVNWAPPDLLGTWLGIGGAAGAGIGNALGTIVASTAIPAGLGYSFAFIVQSIILYGLCFAMALTPASKTNTCVPDYCFEDAQEETLKDSEAGKPRCSTATNRTVLDANRARGTSNADRLVSRYTTRGLLLDLKQLEEEPELPLGTMEQLKLLWENKVFVYSALTLAWSFFCQQGLQYYWTMVFTNKQTWRLPLTFGANAMIVICGLGGLVGLVFLAPMVDKFGGYKTPAGQVKTLVFILKLMLASGVSAVLATCFLYGKRFQHYNQASWGAVGDAWLWLIWFCIAILWACHQAACPALMGLNMEVLPMKMREFGSGVEFTMRNLCGFAQGPLLPGIFMTLVGNIFGMDTDISACQTGNSSEAAKDSHITEKEKAAGRKLYYGFAFIFMASTFSIFLVWRALSFARAKLDVLQEEAMTKIQEAIDMATDNDPKKMIAKVKALDKELAAGRKLDLHRGKAESLMSLANEVRGEVNVTAVPRHESSDDLGSKDSEAKIVAEKVQVALEMSNKVGASTEQLQKSENAQLALQQDLDRLKDENQRLQNLQAEQQRRLQEDVVAYRKENKRLQAIVEEQNPKQVTYGKDGPVKTDAKM